MIKRLVILIILLAAAAAFFYEFRPVWHSETRQLLGTYVEVKIYAEKDKVAQIVDEAFGEIWRTESLLSNYMPESEISFINLYSAQRPISVSDETFDLIKRSQEFSSVSGGRFDITLKGSQFVLDSQDNSVFFSDSSTRIDLGGIAKGYAVDRAVEVLRQSGVTRGLVNAGGDLYCFGLGPRGRHWRIGIEDPVRKSGCIAWVKLADQAIATSGTYRHYDHLIDPRTGQPVENNILGATVIAPDCTTADALATALFIMGRIEGFKMIEALEGVEAVIIEEVGEGKTKINSTSGVELL